MALFSLFKTPRHQRFEYNPRYYNPNNEDIKERIKLAQSDDPKAMKARISKGFKRGYAHGYGAEKARNIRRSNRILLSVIFVLIVLTYLFLTEYLPEIAATVELNAANPGLEE